MAEIVLAKTDSEIQDCYPVMAQLRPHLSAVDFVDQVKKQMQDRFQLACLIDKKPVAVAGFRLGLSLAWGRHMYVDDLVTDEKLRSRGYGGQLLDWLVAYAGEHGCQQLHLDSGVQRFAAHKFYLSNNMFISSHHFTLVLDS